MSASNRRPAAGFTLLEVLLALVIFASLSLAAYEVLQGVLRNDQVTRQKVARLGELQRAMTVMARDFQQALPRAVRGSEEGEADRAVFRSAAYWLESEDAGVSFVRGGWLNPGAQLPRSELQWVGYRLRDNKLERLSRLYPDAVVGSTPQVTTLLDGVTEFKLRYWRNQWLDAWSDETTLPTGIEISLELKDYGHVRRVFTLVESAS